jgi:uncharacterized protein GlcG (DUF336 family)
MQRARTWLADFARQPAARRSRVAPRRLLMPELLESRNAPGAMLPLPPMLGSFAGEDTDSDPLFKESQRAEVRTYYRSDAVFSSPQLHFSIENFIAALRAAEAAGEQSQKQLDTARRATEFRPTAEIAAVNRAMESFVANDIASLFMADLVPPPVIRPVEPPEEEPTEEPEPPSAPEAIAEPTPTGSESTGGSAPVAGAPAVPREDASDPVPAMPAQPAEEPGELSPPMIQPVIMDPESEHNQPSPEPAQVQGETASDSVPAIAAEPTAKLAETVAPVAASVSAMSTPDQLSAAEVDQLLDRATRATSRNDAIIAIVDRQGRILGVHVEQGVLDAIPDTATRVFAIDGAITKARTAAFFSNDEAALTSRTVRFISQTTITEREVEANPNSTDDSIRGPGFVAPIGLGGHFPPDVAFTPHVDLFAIEHTNRDGLVHPGADGIRNPVVVDDGGVPTAATGDDIFLGTRFGANFVAGQEIYAPESYGVVSNLMTNAQSRGIATLPGGVPLYKVDPGDGQSKLVGGIGVFFPGEDGYATFEQGFVPSVHQTTAQRLNAPLVIEAEYTAALIASNTTIVGGITPVVGVGLPNLPGGGRIDLAGITLESFGPHPYKLNTFLAMGQSRFTTGTDTGMRMPVTKVGDLGIAGEQVPTGWLVNPTAGSSLTAQQVEDIITRGIAEAQRVRAAIRLPLGERTAMVLAVTDTDGTVLGLYRMEDATIFSIDVAVAKARNVTYYADPAEIKAIDRVDGDGDGTPDVDAGVAFTNRTFRYLAEPRFPSGIDGPAPPFSTLLTPGVNPKTAENMSGVTPLASDFTTVLGYDAFNPGTNFREDLPSTGYQNGVVFFPGSTPLYNNTALVGGFGVSGDGVDQDDVVTFVGAGEFLPYRDSPVTRADEVFVRDVRLPYQKFLRNPHA